MRLAVLLLALTTPALTTPALAQQPLRPAELPPPEYRGQQYVDSRGCLFMRTGSGGNETWLPRVTRNGVPMCGNPPSGQRVPVAEEGASTAAAPKAAPKAEAGSFYVAVGSFGVAGNAERAAARLAALNYGVAQSRAQGSGGLVTVLAGPFATAEDAARARTELASQGFADATVVGGP